MNSSATITLSKKSSIDSIAHSSHPKTPSPNQPSATASTKSSSNYQTQNTMKNRSTTLLFFLVIFFSAVALKACGRTVAPGTPPAPTLSQFGKPKFSDRGASLFTQTFSKHNAFSRSEITTNYFQKTAQTRCIINIMLNSQALAGMVKCEFSSWEYSHKWNGCWRATCLVRGYDANSGAVILV
jgi:hypothetical protein